MTGAMLLIQRSRKSNLILNLKRVLKQAFVIPYAGIWIMNHGGEALWTAATGNGSTGSIMYECMMDGDLCKMINLVYITKAADISGIRI